MKEEEMKLPTLEDIKAFFDYVGYHYRETKTNEGKPFIISNFPIKEGEGKNVLLSADVEGEFVMLSTVGLLLNVPKKHSNFFLKLNDTIKLVKLFALDSEDGNPETMEINLCFELWDTSCNKETFGAFFEMLGFATDRLFEAVEKEKIPHETRYITITSE